MVIAFGVYWFVATMPAEDLMDDSCAGIETSMPPSTFMRWVSTYSPIASIAQPSLGSPLKMQLLWCRGYPFHHHFTSSSTLLILNASCVHYILHILLLIFKHQTTCSSSPTTKGVAHGVSVCLYIIVFNFGTILSSIIS